MNDVSDGGAAFPSGKMSIGDGDTVAYTSGMTLRDWFAGQAMAGLLAGNDPRFDFGNLATRSYTIADAMLKARAQVVEGDF